MRFISWGKVVPSVAFSATDREALAAAVRQLDSECRETESTAERP